ncbi:HK97-gp10 family putative phage morphogenesis protein [Nonomuraea sp. NPDC003804]|uniref:HK97-gp10 family putative phage morphogenesis protein n=1 Tax=Nonomuraea sp. NPDC003804 TaxID=3154547 RepID=UPI0033A1EE0F
MGWDTSDLDGLIRDLGKAPAKAEALTKAVVAKTGFDAVAAAQAVTPVDTGNLKSSIGVDIDEDGMGFEAGPTANYGHYVHWGTSRMSPRPYLTRPFEQVIEPLPEVFGQVGEKALE